MNQNVDNQLGGYVPPAIGHPEADQAEFMRGYEMGLKAALPAASAEVVECWMPIETAPKDGKIIDLWVVPYHGTAHRFADMFWNSADKCWRNLNNKIQLFPNGESQMHKDYTGSKYEWTKGRWRATHWRYSPVAPDDNTLPAQPRTMVPSEIIPCPYINGLSKNKNVSFMWKDYENYADLVVFFGGKPKKCFRFSAGYRGVNNSIEPSKTANSGDVNDADVVE
jgi:hypothetical protein